LRNQRTLEKLSRTELEGVIAHEMTHIKNYDTRLMSVVAVLVGMVALLGDWFLRIRLFGRDSDRDSEGGALSVVFILLGIIFAIASPLLPKLSNWQFPGEGNLWQMLVL
jgi:heat shock protein HtpX